MGKFFTFEGMDGAGKSTQIKLIYDYLTSLGHDVVLTREPGGCALSETLREMLLGTQSTITPRAEALLFAAARAQHVEEVILPALNKNKIVICDRFLDSSLAYQGFGRNLGLDAVMDINAFALNGLLPHKTFFLYLDPNKSFHRKRRNPVRDRMEQEEETFYQRVFEGFLHLAEKYDRFELIDVSGSKNQTHEKIKAKLKTCLEHS